MPSSRNPLPEFKRPPLIEVALSVQFAALGGFRTIHGGMLYQRYRESGYPEFTEEPPLPRTMERFEEGASGPRSVQMELLDSPPVPRYWFASREGTELIQVQADRFVHNWRKIGDSDSYPRFPRIRDTFVKQIGILYEFVKAEGLGEITPDQCEVTYVNHVPLGGPFDAIGALERVLMVCRSEYSDEFLRGPADGRLLYRFLIPGSRGDPIGRLHVSANPAVTLTESKPVLVLTLTARGAPTEPGIDGAMHFLDLAHEWVVRGFASITTPGMHKVWERTA